MEVARQTKSSECAVDAVRSIRRRHDDDVSSLFQTVHECQQLGDNTSLHLSMSLSNIDNIIIINIIIYLLI